MAAEKDKFAAIIEAAHDGILLLDAQGRVREANAAMARLAGLPGARLRGLDVLELAGGEADSARLRERLAEGCGAAPSPAGVALDMRHADGTVFPAEITLVATRFADGGHGTILYVRDVSERQRYEAALVRTRDRALAADQAKSLLLKMVSHELRTPLSVIEGALELFPREALSEDQAEALGMIRRASGAMTRQVADVLDYSDLKAGRFSLQRAPFELPALLEDLRRGCVAEAARRGLRLEVAGDCPDLRLLGDPGRLSQILLNFIGNAFKFTRDGSVTMSARPVALRDAVAEIEFAVADTGCGIPRKDQDRIFDEFVALDLGYGRTGSGTGLGLAICRRLVEAMAGEIGVDSEPDHGSRFWIRVPLGRAAAPDSEPDRSQAPASAPPVVPGLAILVAEDHEINALLVRKMLESAGHRVTVARDGFEAVRCAAASRFDAILMDISMPRLDGVEATRLIRAAAGASRDTPVIGLTAHAFSEERRVFLSAGMQECLVKPLQRDALDRVLVSLVGSGGAGVPEPADPGAPFYAAQAADFLSGLPAGEAAALIAAFAASAHQDIARIETAFESANLAEAEFHAHRLCGIAGAVGANELARLCAAIERHARAGHPDTPDAVSRLRPSLDAGLAALEAHIRDGS
jgi:PAS domain S-box-containing protein